MLPDKFIEIENDIYMDEAIKYCKEWKKERDWCIKNGLNIE